MELTVSDLYDFKSCPLRFKLTKMDKVVKEISKNDGIREAIQSVINFYYFHLQQGEQLPLRDLTAKLSQIWNDNIDIYDIYIPDNKVKRKMELDAIGMLNTFYRQQNIKPDYVLSSNQEFRVPFGDNLSVRGNIPVIRDTLRGVEIAVFKTGNHKYDEFWRRTDMGITLMAMAYQSMYGRQIDSIAIHTLRDGSTHFVQRTKADYKRLIKSVKLVKASIEQGLLFPRETIACGSCPAKQICMEWN